MATQAASQLRRAQRHMGWQALAVALTLLMLAAWPLRGQAQTYRLGSDYPDYGEGYVVSGLANTNNSDGGGCRTTGRGCLYPLDIAVNRSGQIMVWRKVSNTDTNQLGPHDNASDINGKFFGQMYWADSQIFNGGSVKSYTGGGAGPRLPSAEAYNMIQFSLSTPPGTKSGALTPSSQAISPGSSGLTGFTSTSFVTGTPANGWRGSGTSMDPWYISINVNSPVVNAVVTFKYINGKDYIIVEVDPGTLKQVATTTNPAQFGHYIDTYLSEDFGYSTCAGAVFCGTTSANPGSTTALPTTGVIMGFQRGNEALARIWDRWDIDKYSTTASKTGYRARLSNYTDPDWLDTGIAAQWDLRDASGNIVTNTTTDVAPFSYRVTFSSSVPPIVTNATSMEPVGLATPSWLQHTVTFASALASSTTVNISLTPTGTAPATPGTDTSEVQVSFDGGTTWTTLTAVTANNYQATSPAAATSSMLVRVRAVQDKLQEGNETYNLTVAVGSSGGGTGTGTIQDRPAIIVRKATTAATTGDVMFSFTLTNTAPLTGSITRTFAANTPQAVDTDSTMAGDQPFIVVTASSDATLQETTLPTGFILDTTNSKCTKMVSGSPQTVSTLSGTTYTVAGTHLVANAVITCDMVNRAAEANLNITKTNTPAQGNSDQGADTVVAGSTTTYTIRVTNAGPDAVTDAVVQDTLGSGLDNSTCTVSTACSVVSGTATCPAAADLTWAKLTTSPYVKIPLMNSGSTISFAVSCKVNATP